MQDRYAGDVGDFLKFGLLRHLVGQPDSGVPMRLGVVWYRTADESHNADGKHIAYLTQGHPTAELLRPMDPDLHLRLASIVSVPERSVRALERAAVTGPNVAFFADIHGVRNSRARGEELLDMLRMTPFRDRLADRLSGGMKQKLALACTLIHTPQLLVLDEPALFAPTL